MRNSRLAAAALTAALAAGCRREPAPAVDAAGGVTLAAPAPSSSVVTSPLDAKSILYTNEMQAQNLRDEAAHLGIRRLAKPSTVDGMDAEGPHRTLTYQEGVERTRAMSREAEVERHAIEGDKNKSVALPTETPGVLPPNQGGAPVDDNAPAP